MRPLSAELHISKTLKPDLLFEADDFILHIEIQNYYDPTLPKRMFKYYFFIDLWQEREFERSRSRKIKPIVQILVWVGKGKAPPSEFKTQSTTHRYFVVDMRKLEPEIFLTSKNPYDVMLGFTLRKSF